ncbi:hypothetical protein ABFS82_04G134100 [Erythranthe guttata]
MLAFKLSKRKVDENLELLHTVLFWQESKGGRNSFKVAQEEFTKAGLLFKTPSAGDIIFYTFPSFWVPRTSSRFTLNFFAKLRPTGVDRTDPSLFVIESTMSIFFIFKSCALVIFGASIILTIILVLCVYHTP